MGTIIYSILSEFYKEPLFWLSLILAIPQLILIAFLPSLVFTIIMEFIGIKLFRTPKTHNNKFMKGLIFVLTGAVLGMFYLFTAENNPSYEWYLIITLIGISISIIKMKLHRVEAKDLI